MSDDEVDSMKSSDVFAFVLIVLWAVLFGHFVTSCHMDKIDQKLDRITEIVSDE